MEERENEATDKEAGSGLVGLMVGISLSVAVMIGASQFFMQTKTKSRDMLGESEALAHSTMLVRRGYSDKCALLNLMPGAAFIKGATARETRIATLNEATLRAPGALDAIPMLKAEGMQSYVIRQIDLIQKGNVIGRDPPYVLADVQFTVASSFNTSGQVIKPYSFRVPMMYELMNNTYRIKGCMTKPTAKDICEFRGGSFNAIQSTCT